MVEERRRVRGIQDMRNQQSEIGWMLLWCPLRDVLEKMQVLEKKREKFVEESQHLQKRIEETVAKKDECIAEASTTRQKVNDETKSLQELKGKMKSGEERISSFEQRKLRIIEQIKAFEEESQCEKRKEEIASTKIKMGKITQKEAEMVERLRSAQEERDEFQTAHEQAVANQNQVVRESRKVAGRMRDLQEELHRAEITTKNAVMRFGENIPSVLEVMNANSHKFEHLPRGPI
ncbi:unnamed protein product, partial [Cylicostephanus goldi]